MIKLLILFLLISSSIILAQNPIATTINGQVRGLERKTVGKNLTFYSFSGIPFAQPPVGNLRFASPLPAEDWDGIYDATEDKLHCVSNDASTSSEDCLHLNVYTPQKPNSCFSSLPVLAWIYGGAFVSGKAAYEIDGPDYFLEKDVVEVTFNYRLGAFGFLSTEDDVIPGNFGLKDQVLALKWIQNNIDSFCGDKNRVTIMGVSAGGASVAYHMQSDLSKGLFHQAIMHSGTSLNLWALTRRAKEIAFTTGEQLGLNITDSKSLLEGLRTASLDSLASTTGQIHITNLLSNNAREGLGFSPIIEPDHKEAFITKRSYEVLESGSFSHVPIIMGHTSFEINVPLVSLVGLARLYLLQYDMDNKRMLPIDFNIKAEESLKAANELKQHYFASLPVSLSSLPLLKFVTVDQFERPITKYAKLAQKFTDVYFYRFSYEGKLGSFMPKTLPGVTHGEDMGYFFRNIIEPTEHDKIVRERVLTLWSNFIKNGNPTPQQDPELQNIIWKPLSDNESYLEISNDLIVSNSPNKDMVEFWDKFYQKFANPPHITY